MTVTNATVFVVEDDNAVRDSLCMLLGLKGFSTRPFGSAEALLDSIDPGTAGCVVSDLKMPGMDGLGLQSELSRRGIDLPMIMITAHGDVSTARRALLGGAVDFIEKPIDDEQLVAAIRVALDRDAQRRTDAAREAEVSQRLQRLTERERQVLGLVMAGRHNREIAVELSISPRTVEVYKARMMEKMQVRRLPDLFRMVEGRLQ